MVNIKANKEELASSIERSARSVESMGARTAVNVAGTMRDMADSIRSFNASEYKDRMVNDVRSGVDRNVDNVKTGIWDHPLESVVIAAGAGLIFGAVLALMGRRSIKSRMT